MGTDWKELAESAKFRSDVYGLLATVFRQEPNLDLIRELRGPPLWGVLLGLWTRSRRSIFYDSGNTTG